MASTLDIDESGFPLVVATFRGQMTASLLAPYFARVDAWYRDQLSYACVFDIARCDIPSAADRKRIAATIAAYEAKVERFCVGAALVVTNPVLRGAVTAVLWVHPMRHPHALVGTRQEARNLCAGWLANASRPSA
jgi:hypothetical protein